MQLDGKVAVVTGGGSGIGAAIASRFAAEGATVITFDLNPDLGQSSSNSTAPNVDAMQVDVRDYEAVFNAVSHVHANHGTVDVLVNSAAIAHACPILELDITTWREILDTNLTGVFACSQAAARFMVSHGEGRIINISSVNGQRAVTGRGAYAAAKGGVNMLTKIMATELGSSGVTVNAIAPGPVETAMVQKLHTQAMRDAWHASLPIKRYAMPDEVAAAAVYLASTQASYVTGVTINIDGGFEAAGLILET